MRVRVRGSVRVRDRVRGRVRVRDRVRGRVRVRVWVRVKVGVRGRVRARARARAYDTPGTRVDTCVHHTHRGPSLRLDRYPIVSAAEVNDVLGTIG